MRQWMRLFESEAKAELGPVSGTWYHGTPAAFDAFDVNAGEFESNHETPAIFLTNDPALAEQYASRERPPIKADGLPWGEFKRDFIQPAEAIILRSREPAKDYLARQADRLFTGHLNFDAVCDALPDVAPALRRLMANYEAEDKATSTTMGANIRPCSVTGEFMHVHWLENFNAFYYDRCMEAAKKQGLAGVLFHDIVDTPTGGGSSADILAVFDGRNIKPRFGIMKELATRAVGRR